MTVRVDISRLSRVLLCVAAFVHYACGSPAPSAPSSGNQLATTDGPTAPASPSPSPTPAPAPSPTPQPSPSPAPAPSPAPSPSEVTITGTVRDGLNGDKVSWGMIERYQEVNPAGEKLYQP